MGLYACAGAGMVLVLGLLRLHVTKQAGTTTAAARLYLGP